MYRNKTVLLVGVLFVLNIKAVDAQGTTAEIRQEIMSHFEYGSKKILALAREMPEETYTWSPGEDVFSVARVYMHIARYNFYYPETSLGVAVPEDIDLETMEQITDKDKVLDLLERSIQHVREAVKQMPDAKLEASTELYGRTVDGWVVLLQLVSHMKEHVGQSIAYARMNEVVPPWSR